MSLKLKCETIMGRKDASGIFLGSDDYLLSAPETPNDEAFPAPSPTSISSLRITLIFLCG